MPETRTIVLALSPHAAWLVRECVRGVAEGVQSQAYNEDNYDDHLTPEDAPTLEAIATELDDQLARERPSTVTEIAERMARAGVAAVTEP